MPPILPTLLQIVGSTCAPDTDSSDNSTCGVSDIHLPDYSQILSAGISLAGTGRARVTGGYHSARQWLDDRRTEGMKLGRRLAQGAQDTFDQSVRTFVSTARQLRRDAQDSAEAASKRIDDSVDYTRAYFRSYDSNNVRQNFHLLDRLDSETADSRWQDTLVHLVEQGVSLPDADISTYAKFTQYLHSNGINFDRRVRSVDTALQLVHNRRNLSTLGRNRPIAVVIAPQTDHNTAFEADHFPMADQLVDTNEFDVVYVEVGTDIEAMTELRRIHASSGQRIGRVVFAGHGTARSMKMSEEDEVVAAGLPIEAAYIDANDFMYQDDFEGLDDIIAEDGQVVMWSCSNGQEDVKYNLANVMGRVLPGRDIFATTEPSNIRHIEFKGNRIVHVQWHEDTAYYVNMDEDQRLSPTERFASEPRLVSHPDDGPMSIDPDS